MERSSRKIETKRFHLIFHGRVQGVGFRFFVKREADKRGLNGWVRNMQDGSVELEFDAAEPAARTMIEQCRTGHPWADVRSIDHNEAPMREPFAGFQIRF